MTNGPSSAVTDTVAAPLGRDLHRERVKVRRRRGAAGSSAEREMDRPHAPPGGADGVRFAPGRSC